MTNERAKYVLRELPGVAELEAKLQRIEAHPSPQWAPDMEDLQAVIDRITRHLFGLADEEIGLWFEEDQEPMLFEALTDWGWDLTDGNGQPIKAASELLECMVVATDGKGGHLPGAASDQALDDRSAGLIEAKLAAEAAKWKRK